MKLWIWIFTLACLFSDGSRLEAACYGRVINPVTDVCWACLFPIKVGEVALSRDGANDPETDAPAVCSCQRGPVLTLGLNLSFFEPLRTVEIVREPYCFPSLGGTKMNVGLRAARHGRSSARGRESEARHTAFYQAHWYQTAWLFILETLFDTNCLERTSWDLAYLTEIDPMWDDAWASFIVAPESAIFANPVAASACAADCVSATMGLARNELFWCNGCQGSLYPLSGWVASMISPLQAWHLIAARMSVKLAREGVLWAAYGARGQCGPFVEVIPRKDTWRTQLIYPTVDAASAASCHSLGASTALWGSGKTFPVRGEDGAILLWRKRDCCQSSEVF